MTSCLISAPHCSTHNCHKQTHYEEEHTTEKINSLEYSHWFSSFSSLFDRKIIEVKIIDDEEYEKNKAFTIELGEPILLEIGQKHGGWLCVFMCGFMCVCVDVQRGQEREQKHGKSDRQTLYLTDTRVSGLSTPLHTEWDLHWLSETSSLLLERI